MTRSRPIGVVMLCLWSLGLIVEVVARAALTALRRAPLEGWTFSLTLPLATLVAVSVASLIASCVGLWQMRPWARRLLLFQITAYYGLLFFGSFAVWGPVTGVSIGQPGQSWVTTVVIEGIAGLVFGWWYLNRAPVRAWFGEEVSEVPPAVESSADRLEGEE